MDLIWCLVGFDIVDNGKHSNTSLSSRQSQLKCYMASVSTMKSALSMTYVSNHGSSCRDRTPTGPVVFLLGILSGQVCPLSAVSAVMTVRPSHEEIFAVKWKVSCGDLSACYGLSIIRIF